MSKKNRISQNRSASIRTRTDRNGKLRTETHRRDVDTTSVAVSTDPRSNSTKLFVDTADGFSYQFDGRTARTLYRALQKHYSETQKA